MATLSIIIPHYRTEQYIKLCLRSLRKYSKSNLEVIVVDNGSDDGSIDYLNTVSWINLVVNPTRSLGSRAHAEGLDLGVKRATGEWLCFFHSDTIVLKPGWDDYLIQKMKTSQAMGLSTLERDLNIFEPYSEKCKRRLKELRKSLTSWFFKGKGNQKIMSFCFFIRRDIFLNTGFSFSISNADVVSDLYRDKIKGKYPFLLLHRKELEPLLWHTSNVTSILTGQIKDEMLVDKFNKKKALIMEREEILRILNDNSLDH